MQIFHTFHMVFHAKEAYFAKETAFMWKNGLWKPDVDGKFST